MICTTCIGIGEKSQVWSSGTYSTLMSTSNYWDENDNYHTHNRNERVTRYHCSNGHEWQETDDNQCPSCSWSRSSPHR